MELSTFAILLYCFVASIIVGSFYIAFFRVGRSHRFSTTNGTFKTPRCEAIYNLEGAGGGGADYGALEKKAMEVMMSGPLPFVPQMGDKPLRPYSMNDFAHIGALFSVRNRAAERANDLFQAKVRWAHEQMKKPQTNPPTTPEQEAWVARTLDSLKGEN